MSFLVYDLRYRKLNYTIPRILLPIAYELSFRLNILIVFQKLAHWIIYVAGVTLHESQRAFPCEPCLAYYLYAFLKTNVQDCNTDDCRNDEERTNRLEYYQKLFHRKVCVKNIAFVYFPYSLDHSQNRANFQSIPNIVSRCKKLWRFLCQLSPRTVQYFSVIKSSYQRASCALGQIPGGFNRAGNLCSNYNTIWGLWV